MWDSLRPLPHTWRRSIPAPDPLAEYTLRLSARRESVARQERSHILLGNIRLILFLLAAGIAWLAFARGAISPWWLAAPAAVFIVLAIVHERVIRRRDRARRAAAFYEKGIARLEDRWAGSGEQGERFRDLVHPYAEDLDLFGKGGLFELLSTARTPLGEDTLASWLLAGSTPDAVLQRQSAIAELREKLDLREELALLGDEVRVQVRPDSLVQWAEAAPIFKAGPPRLAAAAISLAVLLSAIAWNWQDLRLPLLIALAASGSFGLRTRPSVLHIAAGVEGAAHNLAILSKVLARLEQEQFLSPRLAKLRVTLSVAGIPPSRRIRHLSMLMEWLDSRENWLMRMIGPPLLYATQLAFALETWRTSYGPRVRSWLEAVGEMEALSSLASYAYEHPADPFPEFDSGPAHFEAEAIGHPLLPEDRSVRNDVRLGGEPRVLIVSGSNMSGKSTLLRSVGVNAVLAMAGAPVRARSLRMSWLAVGASIRTTDSLQGGASRFYAEITRLRALVDLANGPCPLLFLIDELLNGTNSHDRRIGAGGIVRGLLDRGAIGLITTHDLALTEIAESSAPSGANVHFEDHLENGKITFDYRLRPGIVQKSNALELMRSVGLDV